MADDRIEIEIVLDDGSIQKGFAKIRQEADKTKGSIGSVFKSALGKDISKPFDIASKSIFNLRNAVGLAIAAIGGGAFLRSITAAASEQQDAINTLNNSLRTAGTFSQAASKDFQDFASSLQSASKFGDEVILQQLALARNFTKTNDEAKKLTKAAIELSSATGLSLEGSIKNLGKTFGGLTGELGESVPALRNLTVEQLKSGAAIDFVTARFGGSALAATRTYSGALAQLQNTYGGLLESLGETITNSPVIVNLFNALSTTISGLTGEFKGAGFSIDDFLKSLVIKSAAVANAVVDSFKVIAQLPSFFLFTLTQIELKLSESLQRILVMFAPSTTILDSVLGISGSTDKNLEQNEKFLNGLRQTLDDLTTGGLEIAKGFDFATATIDSFITTFQELSLQKTGTLAESPASPIVDAIDKDLVKLRESVKKLQTETIDAINQSFYNADSVLTGMPSVFENLADKGTEALKELQAELTKTKDKAVQISLQISQAVNNGIANTITNSVSAVVDALRTGKNAFSAFGKAALATIGDLAVQLGTTLIAAGIGIEAIKGLVGAQAIVAGVALVAIGSVIKGAAGGGAPNVGGGSSVTPPLSDLQPGGISSDLQDQGARVQVTIEGNIFDSDETGLRIANILKDQGFQNAVIS